MKIVWVGIALLIAIVTVGIACGPKEKYCYADHETCNAKQAMINMDAAFEAPEVDAEAGGTCFSTTGDPVPCSPG